MWQFAHTRNSIVYVKVFIRLAYTVESCYKKHG